MAFNKLKGEPDLIRWVLKRDSALFERRDSTSKGFSCWPWRTECYVMRRATCKELWMAGMWELDCEEGWVLRNWCFWTVVLEKTLESPLECKEIQPVHSEGDQPWVFFGKNDAKVGTPVLWPSHAKSWLIGKDSDAGRDWGQEEKGTTEDEMTGWYHWLDGRESGWTPGVGNWQGGLACCNSWGRQELDTTEQLKWTVILWLSRWVQRNH